MFHIGRFSDTSLASKLCSTICVMEFLTRLYPGKQSGGEDYPLSCIFVAKSKFDTDFMVYNHPLSWWRFVRVQYDQMRLDLKRNCKVTIAAFECFSQMFRLAKKVLVRLAKIFQILSQNNNINVHPASVCAQMVYLEQLLAGYTKNVLRKDDKVLEVITEKTLSRAWEAGPDYAGPEGSNEQDQEEENEIPLSDLDNSLPETNDENGGSTTSGDDQDCDNELSEDEESIVYDDESDEEEDNIFFDIFDSDLSGDDDVDQVLAELAEINDPDSDSESTLLDSESLESKSKRRKLNNSSVPRIQRPWNMTRNPDHDEEDFDIPARIPLTTTPKPGGYEPLEGSPENRLGGGEGVMFDDDAVEFCPPRSILPTIVIETFRNNKGEIVRGPYKYVDKDGTRKGYPIGSEQYLHKNKGDVHLRNVLFCRTSKAYVYFFKDANLRPHFVIGENRVPEYCNKLDGLDVDLRSISQWKTRQPVKVLSDYSIQEGLREGVKEESDFTFVSDQTDLWREYFGSLGDIPFPTSKWMNYFDGKTDTRDKQGRGFAFGHEDVGFGREGVAQSAHLSQQQGREFVLGKPCIIGDSEMMKTLGPVVDRTTMLMDTICFDNGGRLMNDSQRNSMFGAKLRTLIRSRHSRFEAFTIVRQPLGKAADVLGGKIKFNGTHRHLDGPNCTRQSYRMTAVFSYLCVWNEVVYRMSIIMYTRASCGNYCWRNYFARILRRRLRDYIVEYNGGVHYRNLCLTKNMEWFQGEYGRKASGKNQNECFFLKPKEYNLSETFFERLRFHNQKQSRWTDAASRTYSSPSWKPFNWDDKMDKPLNIIAFPEFFCRFGFCSSFASQINRFVAKDTNIHGECPREIIYQLLYISLISTSQVQFYYILNVLIGKKREVLARYKELKRCTGETDVSVFRLYQDISTEKFTCITGGPYNRVQAQPCRHPIFESDKELRKNIEKIPKVLDDIQKGRFLDQSGVINGRPGRDLAMVGDVASISCAPIVMFVGLAEGDHAANTAKQTMVNVGTTNSYFPKLQSFLDAHDNGEPKTKKDKEFVVRIGRAIAKSWNDVMGSVENGCCAEFRGKMKCDVFFKGQDLYILDDTSCHVKVKRWGNTDWETMTYP